MWVFILKNFRNCEQFKRSRLESWLDPNFFFRHHFNSANKTFIGTKIFDVLTTNYHNVILTGKMAQLPFIRSDMDNILSQSCQIHVNNLKRDTMCNIRHEKWLYCSIHEQKYNHMNEPIRAAHTKTATSSSRQLRNSEC